MAAVSHGTLEYHGTQDFLNGSGGLSMQIQPSQQKGFPVAGNLQGELGGGKFHLQPGKIRFSSSSLDISGDFTGDSADAKIHAEVPRPADLASLYSGLRKVPGSYTADGTIRGPYRNLQADAVVIGQSSQMNLQANVSYQTGAGNMHLVMNGNADASIINRFYAAGLQGKLTMQADVSGDLAHPAGMAEIIGESLRVRETVIDSATIKVNGNGRAVDLTAEIPKYGVTANGTYVVVNHQYRLNANINNLDLAQLSPFLPASAQGLAGALTADLSAGGNANRWKDSTAEFIVRSASLKRNDLQAEISSGDFRLANRQITVAMQVKLPDGSLNIDGIAPITRTGRMQLHAIGQANLGMLSLFTDQLQGAGVVNLDVNAAGTPAKPEFSGKAASQTFSLEAPAKHVQLLQASLDAEFSGQKLTLKTAGILNGSPLEVQGSVSFAGNPGELHVKIKSLNLSTLSPTSKVSGSIGIDLQAYGDGIKPANWSGDVTITPSHVSFGGTALESEPLQVHMDTGRVELKTAHLKAGNLMNAAVGGAVNLRTGEIAASFQGNTDLVILTEFTDSARAGGAVNANLRVGGNLAHPTFQGDVELKNGIIRVLDSPILLENVNAKIPVAVDRIQIANFSAKMGGGNITAGGGVQLNNWQPGPLNLWLKTERIGMNYPAGLHSQISADLKITNVQDDYLVSGNVLIDRSMYREDIDPRERLVNTLLSAKSHVSADTTTNSHVQLDIRVETIQNFMMRNNLGKAMAAAKLRVTGTLMEPRVSGRLRVTPGSEVAFLGNTFEVRRGNVDFYGHRKMTPVLDLELFTIATDTDTKDEYEITLPVSGPADNLDERDPSSSPPLAPNQIYFLLLTGRADAQLSSAGAQFFQQQLASYLAGQVFSDVQKKVAGAFGLNRVEVQPEIISSETSPGAKLVLGKDFNRSLSLVYSTSLTDSGEQTWIARYKIRRNLDVRFVDQEDGTYTANIRNLTRFGSGRSPQSLRTKTNRPRVETIRSITIKNDSSLNVPQIQNELGLKEGDSYDYWDVQDRIDAVKQLLQRNGYLFPIVTLDEKDTGNGNLALSITVSAKKPSDMAFEGNVTKNQVEKYRKWWREGFSEQAVLELIHDDLERAYWFQGYHDVTVKQYTQTNGTTVYHFAILAGTKYEKVNLNFKGAVGYTPHELEEDIVALYPSREELNADVVHRFSVFQRKLNALYVKKGFLEAKATEGPLNKEPTVLTKEIDIAEGPQSRIADILVRGSESFPPDLYDKLLLKEGALYDPRALEEDEMTIHDYYESKGYHKFQVQSDVRKGDGTSDLIVEYHVQPGGIAHIVSISIKGLLHSQESLIRKRLDFKNGDIITHDKLVTAQKNLYDLRIFNQVTVQANETQIPNQYDVAVDVAEIQHYELTYGLRYDTEKGIGGELQLADLNLFGSGNGISAYGRVNRSNQLYRTVYHTPTLAGLKWKTLITGSYETGDLTLREGNNFSLAEGQRALFQFQRQRKIRDPFLLITSYEFEYLRNRPRDAFFAPLDVFRISRLIGTVLQDTRDDPVNAKRGTLLSVDLQYSPSLLGDVNYVKNYTQWYRFQKVGRMTWASAVRLGMASHLDPRLITERFLAGGSYTIRGFAKDQVGPMDVFGNPIGGEALFIINQELRVPLYKWFGAAAFYDAGNVYNKFTDFNPIDLRHSFGFGLRFDSPFGVARFDVGINPSRRRGESLTVFHFGLGQAF